MRVVVQDEGALPEPEQVRPVGVGQVVVGEDLGRRPGGHHPAGEQEQMAGLVGVAEVVRGHHDGTAGGPLGLDHLEDPGAGHEVEAGERLVEEEQLCVLGEALGHERPLALAAGELVQGLSDQLGEPEGLDGAVDQPAILGAQPAYCSGGGVPAHRDRLVDAEREVRADLGALEHVGDAAATLRRRHVEVARSRGEEPGQRVQERGLPRAVRPDQGGDGAAGHLEARARQHHRVVVREDEVAGESGRRGDGSGGRSDLRIVAASRTFLMMRTVLVLVAAGMIVTAGCGDDDTDGSAGRGAAIVVTTNILGDVVGELVGDDVEVEVLMPPNANPHDFAASARQAADMRVSDVLVVNGLGFEAGLEDAIDAAEDDGATVVAVAELAPGHLTLGEEAYGHDEEGEHAHEGEDPHVFTDPARMAVAVDALADALAREADGLESAAFRARADA